jgi:diguanylate cyclase (GGDEF)-like protein/PAS domain S-box-containing protein
MKDQSKTKQILIQELVSLRHRISELERSESELKRAKEVLKDSEAKYQSLAENMADVVFAVDLNLMTTYVSPSIERLLGFTPQERMAQKADQQLTLKSQKLVFDTLSAELGREKEKGSDPDRSETLELEYYHKDGSIKHLLTYIRGIRDSEGNLTGFYGSSHDITERKRAREALRVSETSYRLLAENARDVIWTVDMDMRLTYVSPSVKRLLGFTEEEAMARTIRQAFTPAAFEKAMRIFAEEMAIESAGFGDPNRSRILELDLVRKDGNTVPVEGNFCFLRDRTEKAIGMLSILRDITERKRMEDEILALSITDQLTGLHNRRGFLSLAEQQLKLSNRNKNRMLLFFADLDLLKWINDTMGHEEGDKALIEAATVFKETFRTSDIIARLGGDEYAALTVDITDTNSEILTARMQSVIDTRNNRENRKYRLSISVGCSYYDPENPCTIDDLIVRADKLMYEQKQNKQRLLTKNGLYFNK